MTAGESTICRGVVRGDAEGDSGWGRQVAFDGGLGVVVFWGSAVPGEDVAVVVWQSDDRLPRTYGPVGDAALTRARLPAFRVAELASA